MNVDNYYENEEILLNNDIVFQPKNIIKDQLSKDDIQILHDLERKNKITYNDGYVSEFLKCRNNPLYFIHNYCHISEVGTPRLYTKDMMNKKYRRLVKCLYKYHKCILMASRQLGKALDLNTIIPLSNGKFKKLKDVHPGDKILGTNGKEINVIAESIIFKNKKCFKIKFDNQETVIASEDHQWIINNKKYTTNNIFLEFNKTKKYNIRLPKPIYKQKQKYLIPPYLIGLYLSKINNFYKIFLNNKIIQILKEKYKIEKNQINLKEIDNNFNNNFIYFEQYLNGSVYQRINLLRGLMDSCGYCDKYGNSYFCHYDKNIIKYIKKLLSSLSIKFFTKYENNTNLITIKFVTKKFYVFNIKEFRKNQKNIKNNNFDYIKIINIEEIRKRPCKCLTVDSSDHLFLITKSMIPTHNSTIGACLLAHAITFYPGIRACIFNMDMNAGMENINKVKFILENLPDWMRFTPRRITTKTYIDLTNDAKISVFYPSTIKSPEQLSRSLTIPILYVDKLLSTIKK